MRVLRIISWRMIAAVPTLALVAIGIFLLLSAAPGDAADAYLAQIGGDAGFAARLREDFGLTGSVAARFWAYLARLSQGDLGQSLVFNRPVLGLILERLPVTLLLMCGAVGFAAMLGGILGLVAGARPGSRPWHSVCSRCRISGWPCC
jgi:peptide/nickel transport system permease protein